MSVSLVDGEQTGAAFAPRRGAPTDMASRQWQRQLEAELAGHSVCRALAVADEARGGGDAGYGESARGGAAAGPAESGLLARRPAVIEARAAAVTAAPARQDGPAPLAARMPSSALATGWWQALAEPEGAAVQGTEPVRATDVETVVRSWLKPQKLTVFRDGDQIRIWIRDSRLDADNAQAVCLRLQQMARDGGGRLALLTINGTVVQTSDAGQTKSI